VHSSPEALRDLARRLPDDMACALGPIVHYEHFEQPDGSLMSLKADDVDSLPEYNFIDADALLVLGASKGSLRLCSLVDAALVELDAPPSARDGQ
jgi:hypothetical protein